MPPQCNGVAGSTPFQTDEQREYVGFHMRLYNHSIHLIWADGRPTDIRPVHAGEDPQEVMNNWKEELCY